MKKIILLLWCCLSGSLSAQALTLPEVIDQLRQDYPPLMEVQAKVRQNEGKLLEKEGGFDTKLKGKADSIPLGYYQHLALDTIVEQATPWWGTTFFSGYRLGQGNIADYDGKKNTLNLGEFRTGVNVPLLRNGPIDPLRAEISRLRLAVDIARLKARESELKFVSSALKAYWGWVEALQKERIATELLRLTQTRLEQLEAEIQLGKKPPIDRLENQRALLKRQNKLLDVQQKRQSKSLELGLFLTERNLPEQTPTPFFPSVNNCMSTEVPLQQAVTDALEQRPERLSLSLQLAQNDVGLALAQNQFLPNLDLYLSLSQDIGEGDKNLAPLNLETGLKFDFPFQWRKAQGQTQQLEAERDQLQLQYDFVSESIRAEIAEARVVLNTSCQQIEMARQESELALKLAAAERERFALGGSDLFIVNLREQSAADAQDRLQEALSAYFLAEGQYMLSLGLLPQR
ncbi:MAG: TolC family protein [Candidatus Sericytochromatia bacterium]|nr:TolC family protein [Candidatus Sericytochromatia bacterium]